MPGSGPILRRHPIMHREEYGRGHDRFYCAPARYLSRSCLLGFCHQGALLACRYRHRALRCHCDCRLHQARRPSLEALTALQRAYSSSCVAMVATRRARVWVALADSTWCTKARRRDGVEYDPRLFCERTSEIHRHSTLDGGLTGFQGDRDFIPRRQPGRPHAGSLKN